MGASFVGISPDHPISKALEAENPEIAAKIADMRKGGTTAEAIETAEKLGYDTGIRVKHPLDPNWELPVWIANFILMDYGTGAIFACPAHDQRDLDFCRKYDLPVVEHVLVAGRSLARRKRSLRPAENRVGEMGKPLRRSGHPRHFTGD